MYNGNIQMRHMGNKELNRLKSVQQIRDNQLRVVEAAALLGLSRS
ncbi:hypothetical protein EDF68_1401, partial [Ochrobactrum sp. BH3]